MADVDDELLDRASQFAFAIAREDHLARPRRPVPGPLQRHVGFARTPPATLRVVRRVVDDDEAFRARVAEKVTEADVGRAGLLWLTRPEGWAEQLDELRGFLASDDEEAADRRLADDLAAELEEARHQILELGVERDRLAAELDEERRARRGAEAETRRARDELAELRDERNRAVREWKRIERLRNEEKAEVAAARARLDAPASDLGPSDSGPAGSGGEAVSERVRAARRALADVEAEMTVLRADIADAEGRLAAALEGVARTLDELADPVPQPVPVAPSEPTARRTPPPLGRGLLDDTVAAADALVRLDGVTILVDGYNLTLGAMPEVPLAEGRDRLVAALDNLHARTGARSVVVFDGSEAGSAAGRSRWVQVRFTDHAVEADDVLIDLVRTSTGPGPLVVVSSDNRVRDGVREAGARPISSTAFAEYLGLVSTS